MDRSALELDAIAADVHERASVRLQALVRFVADLDPPDETGIAATLEAAERRLQRIETRLDRIDAEIALLRDEISALDRCRPDPALTTAASQAQRARVAELLAIERDLLDVHQRLAEVLRRLQQAGDAELRALDREIGPRAAIDGVREVASALGDGETTVRRIQVEGRALLLAELDHLTEELALLGPRDAHWTAAEAEVARALRPRTVQPLRAPPKPPPPPLAGEPAELVGDQAHRWAADLAAALRALRLNQQFPPWARLAAWIAVMGRSATLRLDREAALPLPREWVRVRVGRDLADEALAELAAIDPRVAGAAQIARHQALRALEPLPASEVRVDLRHVEGTHASWRVVLDRFDVQTATVARYTLIVGDRVGRTVDADTVRPTTDFARRLEVLSTEDAALAFAILRDREQLDVQEVVRGVVGPAVLPGVAGPDGLRDLPARGPVLSACLERASLDLQDGHLDDPLAASVVVPSHGAGFGISRQRKWALPDDDLAALRAWLTARGSRNLVYGFPRRA